MFDVEGYILVGGLSSRMGSDKSQLVFGRQTGVARVATALRALSSRVRVVGARDQGTGAGLENVPDLYERWGALGGIQTALAACESEYAVITACDLPLINAELLVRLWGFVGQTESDAIVPLQPDERPQPLCAIYRREYCAAAAQQLIAQGEHKPRALLAKVRTRWVKFSELSDLPGASDFFLNVNTPGDYERAKKILVRNRSQ